MKKIHRKMIQLQAAALRRQIKIITGPTRLERRMRREEKDPEHQSDPAFLPYKLKGLLAGLNDVKAAQLYRAAIGNDDRSDMPGMTVWLNMYMEKMLLLSAFNPVLFGRLHRSTWVYPRAKLIISRFHNKPMRKVTP